MSETAGDARILVVDDEEQIRRFLRISLRSQGYEVIEADTAASGLQLAATRAPDLVVLDLGLPDADGGSVLAELRGWSTVPVLILSVRASEREKVRLFDQGANDYVTKPFGIEEFLARVRSLLRHATEIGGTGAAVYDDGHLRIDLAAHRVSLAGNPVHLTRKEFAIFKVLLTHAGQVVTQSQLLREIWGQAYAGRTHYLRNFIGRIREKIGDDSAEPRYLETEPGVGYRFVDRRS